MSVAAPSPPVRGTNPPSGNRVTIDGRLVVISRGSKSQTVSVCTTINEVGTYDEKYSLRPCPPVASADLAELADLGALRAWLATQDAVLVTVGPGRGNRLPALVPAKSVDARWLRDARAAVDQAISTLVEQFLADPYMHRREHSLHAALYQLLKAQPHLRDEVRLRSGELTQLVHKEWPETFARRLSGAEGPRGSFDLAILAPSQLEKTRLDQFRIGRVNAPIVIEVGLDYGDAHLHKDKQKLLHSKVTAPYLLHLSRIAVTDSSKTEDLACSAAEPLRVAYVHHDPKTNTRRVKRLGDAAISVC